MGSKALGFWSRSETIQKAGDELLVVDGCQVEGSDLMKTVGAVNAEIVRAGQGVADGGQRVLVLLIVLSALQKHLGLHSVTAGANEHCTDFSGRIELFYLNFRWNGLTFHSF